MTKQKKTLNNFKPESTADKNFDVERSCRRRRRRRLRLRLRLRLR